MCMSIQQWHLSQTCFGRRLMTFVVERYRIIVQLLPFRGHKYKAPIVGRTLLKRRRVRGLRSINSPTAYILGGASYNSLLHTKNEFKKNQCITSWLPL